MPSAVQMIKSVSSVITGLWPNRFDDSELAADVSLGEEGLGLDSVEIVEVILVCEETFGRQATEELFAAVPLTLARMAGYFLS